MKESMLPGNSKCYHKLDQPGRAECGSMTWQMKLGLAALVRKDVQLSHRIYPQ
jgi:hypothetical protein